MSKTLSGEESEQSVLCAWLTLKRIRFYSVPNGGYRNPREAAKLKRLGVSKGVPDICIPYGRNGLAGLYIELKRREMTLARISQEQKDWLAFLLDQGYYAAVAYGASHAIDIVKFYFDDELERPLL